MNGASLNSDSAASLKHSVILSLSKDQFCRISRQAMRFKSLLQGLRTLLILGRISNLPTVWSNLLAGSILANVTPNYVSLLLVLLGGSFLYIGGMYLNDYCDADFDIRYCPERPVPSGRISRHGVGLMAGTWFTTGLACFVPFGVGTFAIALLLLAAIVIYDCLHKGVFWAPLMMGACRFLLYPLAASAFIYQGVLTEKFAYVDHSPLSLSEVAMRATLGIVPAAVPLGIYVAGITYLARGESRPGKPTRWALLLLFLPLVFACGTYVWWNSSLQPPAPYFTSFPLSIDYGNTPYRHVPCMPVVLICGLQLYWMAWLLVPFWRKTNPSISRIVSGLLAGIVLVDMLALAPAIGPLGVILFPLFLLALLLQRFIPAT